MKQRFEHNKFDQWLNHKMDDLEVVPPAFNALFTEETKPSAIVKKIVVGSVFILFLFIPLFYTTNPLSFEPSVKEFTSFQTQKGKPLAIKAGHSNSEVPVARPSKPQYSESSPKYDPKKEQDLLYYNEKKLNKERVSGEQGSITVPIAKDAALVNLKLDEISPILPSLTTQSLVFDAKTAPSLIIPSFASIEKTSIRKSLPGNKHYVGVMGSISFNQIINHNTYGLYEQSKVSFEDSFLPTFGVYMGRRIAPKTFVEVGFNFLVNHNLKRELVLRGNDITHSTQLLYHQLPIVIRQEHFSNNKGLSGYFEGGVQYARLLAAKIQVDESSLSVYQRFKEDEYSFILGYSASYRVSERLSLEAALRARVGSGINDKQWLVHNSYGQSHNLSLALQFRMSYWLNR